MVLEEKKTASADFIPSVLRQAKGTGANRVSFHLCTQHINKQMDFDAQH